MAKVKKIADLRAEALGLVEENLFLSEENRKKWLYFVPKMKKVHLEKLITVLNQSEDVLRDALGKYFEKHPDGGELMKKTKELMVVYRGKVASADHEQDASAAEAYLKNSLKNL